MDTTAQHGHDDGAGPAADGTARTATPADDATTRTATPGHVPAVSAPAVPTPPATGPADAVAGDGPTGVLPAAGPAPTTPGTGHGGDADPVTGPVPTAPAAGSFGAVPGPGAVPASGPFGAAPGAGPAAPGAGVGTLSTVGDRLAAFRLRRSSTDRMLGGVCGGLAADLGVDAALLRIAVLVLTLLTGGGAALVYLAAWILAPVS